MIREAFVHAGILKPEVLEGKYDPKEEAEPILSTDGGCLDLCTEPHDGCMKDREGE